MPATVPDLPADGQWRSDQGELYVTHATALGMGFTPPFLKKYRTRNHVALGRPIDCTRQKFRHARSNGMVTHHGYFLYALSDLSLIRAARAGAAAAAGPNPVNGYLPKTVVMRSRPGARGKVCVQFVKSRPPRPKRMIPADDRISLPDAARRLGIPLATLHTWTRRECPFLERRLSTTKRPGRTRDVDCIDPADYQVIARHFGEARTGRLIRASRAYLSPPAADREFVLPRGRSSARQFLENRRRSLPVAGGQRLRTIDGYYLDGNGRGQFGKCYYEEDLKLFRRRRPAPPAAALPPEPAQASIGTCDDRPPTGAAQFGTAEKATRPSIGGRRRSEATEEVYRFCYQMFGAAKRSTIMKKAAEMFGKRAPKQEPHVTLFAKRHAANNNLPWPKTP